MAFRKGRKRATKGVKRPRQRKANGVSTLAKLSKQVKRLTRSFKPELKEFNLTSANNLQYFGQVLVNTAGYYAYDLTPVCLQGTANNSRIGSQIRVKRCVCNIQLVTMNSFSAPVSIKWLWVRNKGLPSSPSGLVADMFKANPFIYTAGGANAGIIDYNSLRENDFQQNYQVLRTIYTHIPIEPYASSTMVKNIKLNLNFKTPKLVTYDNNTNAVASGSFVLIGLFSSGNSSPSGASTLTGIPVQAALTGFQVLSNLTWHYYDN